MSLKEFYCFVEDYSNVLQPINSMECESRVNCPNAFLAFQSLKGLTLTLSFNDLAAISARLTELLKEREPINDETEIKELNEESMFLRNGILMS